MTTSVPILRSSAVVPIEACSPSTTLLGLAIDRLFLKEYPVDYASLGRRCG